MRVRMIGPTAFQLRSCGLWFSRQPVASSHRCHTAPILVLPTGSRPLSPLLQDLCEVREHTRVKRVVYEVSTDHVLTAIDFGSTALPTFIG